MSLLKQVNGTQGFRYCHQLYWYRVWLTNLSSGGTYTYVIKDTESIQMVNLVKGVLVFV